MKSPIPETVSFCCYAKRWMLGETPKKCPNGFCCDGCEHHEMRKPTKHLIQKLRKLEVDDEASTSV